jgi:D-sedoheptulose 7-phosphate isomerase
MEDGRHDAANTLKDSVHWAAKLFTSVAMDQMLHAQLGSVADQVVKVLKSGGTLFACGNGGSASQATHVTGELVGPFFDRDRRPLRAIPLGFDPSSLTAIANDFNYQIIFSRQLQALGKPGDMLWAFSTSGNSPNVLAAMETAKAMGITTVLFSNHDGGRARLIADYFLYTPQSSTPRVQELHLLYAHILCEIIELQCA